MDDSKKLVKASFGLGKHQVRLVCYESEFSRMLEVWNIARYDLESLEESRHLLAVIRFDDGYRRGLFSIPDMVYLSNIESTAPLLPGDGADMPQAQTVVLHVLTDQHWFSITSSQDLAQTVLHNWGSAKSEVGKNGPDKEQALRFLSCGCIDIRGTDSRAVIDTKSVIGMYIGPLDKASGIPQASSN